MEIVKEKNKKIEIQISPSDWRVTTLKKLCSEKLQNGVFFKPSKKGRGIKLINVGDLYKNYPINISELELFDANVKEEKRYKVVDGDLFFTRSSVVPSGIAQCNIYINKVEEKVVFDSHVIRVRPDKKVINPDYFFRYCLSQKARNYFVSHAKTATMTTIDQNVLGKCPIIVPRNMTEQTTISTTLSNVDKLISGLEKLIAKKRNIKRGAMQELLKPKKDWEKKKIVDNFQLLAGKSKSNFIEEGGDYIIIDMGSVSTQGEIIYNKRTNRKADLLNLGDLVMPKDDIGGGNIIGKVAFINENNKYVLGDHVFKLKPNNSNIDSLFFSFLINSQYVNKYLKHKVSGSAQLGLGRSSVEEQEIFYPKEKNEQMRISNIIEDMNIELRRLEINLLKYKMLKQGMMQNLLTGKIRLV